MGLKELVGYSNCCTYWNACKCTLYAYRFIYLHCCHILNSDAITYNSKLCLFRIYLTSIVYLNVLLLMHLIWVLNLEEVLRDITIGGSKQIWKDSILIVLLNFWSTYFCCILLCFLLTCSRNSSVVVKSFQDLPYYS